MTDRSDKSVMTSRDRWEENATSNTPKQGIGWWPGHGWWIITHRDTPLTEGWVTEAAKEHGKNSRGKLVLYLNVWWHHMISHHISIFLVSKILEYLRIPSTSFPMVFSGLCVFTTSQHVTTVFGCDFNPPASCDHDISWWLSQRCWCLLDGNSPLVF